MTLLVTALLLLAAFIHASWNAVIKGARDPVAMAILIYGTEAAVMLPALLILGPLPQSVWLLMTVHVLLHIVYKILLIQMYQHGDLSQVYPVARGVAPLLVTALAIPAADEIPSAASLIGIILVCPGLLSFAIERGRSPRSARPAWFSPHCSALLSWASPSEFAASPRRSSSPPAFLS